MSYVDDLLAAYERFVSLPWQQTLAPPQRIWMAVYPPEQERRLRAHLQAFEVATKKAEKAWGLVDVGDSFERWMATHPYRDEYLEDPDLLETALPALLEHLTEEVRAQLRHHPSENGVVAMVGAGSLFGLGDALKVSALLNAVNDAVSGRLLVFFPGEVENNRFRLLDARDGWDYMAIVIRPSGSER